LDVPHACLADSGISPAGRYSFIAAAFLNEPTEASGQYAKTLAAYWCATNQIRPEVMVYKSAIMIKRLFPKFNLARDPESRLGQILQVLKRLLVLYCFAFTWSAILREFWTRIGFSDYPTPLSLNASFYLDAFAFTLLLYVFEKMEEYDKRVANPDQ
jgi:hypothetical protein